jgi:hypothetical protein
MFYVLSAEMRTVVPFLVAMAVAVKSVSWQVACHRFKWPHIRERCRMTVVLACSRVTVSAL